MARSEAQGARRKSEAFSKVRLEFSAGGVCEKEGSVLLCRVKNLQGKLIWTFPKGHIEKGETPSDAAIREVLEETGWLCRIVKPLFLARYFFRWRGSLIKKSVRWFLMEPVRKTGVPDATEILETRWVSHKEAQRLTRYPSDKKLLRLISAH